LITLINKNNDFIVHTVYLLFNTTTGGVFFNKTQTDRLIFDGMAVGLIIRSVLVAYLLQVTGK